MDLKLVFELMEKLEKSKLIKLEVNEKDFSIKLEKEPSVMPTVPAPQSVVPVQINQDAPTVKGNIVTAPIVGTFYQAAGPDKEPFVKVGQTVQEGDVVCIIEAMKLFNEVQSDFSGTVKKILVQDGDLLEYGQPIMILE